MNPRGWMEAIAAVDFGDWIDAVRARVAEIDPEQWLETVGARLAAIDFGALVQGAGSASGMAGDLPLRLLAGVAAVVTLGTAVVLTRRMIRQQRHARAKPGAALVTTRGDDGTTSIVRVVPRPGRATHSSAPPRGDRIDRVGRLANLGATPAQVARAIGLSRDALAILAPTTDWNRPKLPRAARTAARETFAVTMQRRLTRRVIA